MSKRVYRQRGSAITPAFIEERSIPEPNSGCWLWLHARTDRGYGSVWFGGSTASAHRASFEAHFGPIEDGKFVCHRCDNRACVNPDHLFLGDRQDNVDDMMRKGRNVSRSGDLSGARKHPERFAASRARHRGENTKSNKLTSSQVLDVLARFARGESRAALAAAYSVSYTCIKLIVAGKSWRHLSLAEAGQ